jgi:hypothetical protein
MQMEPASHPTRMNETLGLSIQLKRKEKGRMPSRNASYKQQKHSAEQGDAPLVVTLHTDAHAQSTKKYFARTRGVAGDNPLLRAGYACNLPCTCQVWDRCVKASTSMLAIHTRRS